MIETDIARDKIDESIAVLDTSFEAGYVSPEAYWEIKKELMAAIDEIESIGKRDDEVARARIIEILRNISRLIWPILAADGAVRAMGEFHDLIRD